VLGTVLAILIPILTRPMLEDHPRLHKPWLAIRYLLVLFKDIVLCNIEVARQVMTPISRLTPGFIAVPLDITGKFPITLLANTISLTPGTVSVDVSEDLKWLYVHALNLGDEQAVIRAIKQNYEAPLKEMFAC
jgi:multicomponent K+:H+ antiporter subunit E